MNTGKNNQHQEENVQPNNMNVGGRTNLDNGIMHQDSCDFLLQKNNEIVRGQGERKPIPQTNPNGQGERKPIPQTNPNIYQLVVGPTGIVRRVTNFKYSLPVFNWKDWRRSVNYPLIQEETESRVKQIQEETESKAKRTIALNFLRGGLSVEVVAQGTGLSIEEVQQLQQQLNGSAQS